VVEEVFFLAFDHFETRPPNVSLGDWLESLVDPALHALVENPEEEFRRIEYVRIERELSE
jgi:hypothetical protein